MIDIYYKKSNNIDINFDINIFYLILIIIEVFLFNFIIPTFEYTVFLR